MSLLSRVPAAFAPRGSEPARHGARRLSPVEMSGTKTLTRNTKEKQNQNENATRYTRRLIYCLAIVRQRKGRFPGQNARTLSPEKAMELATQ